MIRIPAMQVQAGDLIDLEGDPFADPARDHHRFASEFQQVVEVTREGRSCVAIGFEGLDIVGFPLTHLLKLACRPAQ